MLSGIAVEIRKLAVPRSLNAGCTDGDEEAPSSILRQPLEQELQFSWEAQTSRKEGNYSNHESFDGLWRVELNFDCMVSDKNILLGETCIEKLSFGKPETFKFHVPSIDVSSIDPGSLQNIAILRLSLIEAETSNAISSHNFVVNVATEDGALIRTIYMDQ